MLGTVHRRGRRERQGEVREHIKQQANLKEGCAEEEHISTQQPTDREGDLRPKNAAARRLRELA